MRMMVTGAAGFIGSHLSEALRAAGHEVVALDGYTDYYDPSRKRENAAGLGVLDVDLAHEPFDLAGLDAVFHLAGQPGTRSFGEVFPTYLERNVLVTQRVFEAAVEAAVPVVWASSSSVYGDAERYPTPEDVTPRPNNPYGITKLACEHLHETYARQFGLHAVGLRYFTVYGPRQRPDMAFARVVDALAEGRPFEVYGDGAQSRSFTYVADVVEATDRGALRGAGHLQRGRGRGGDAPRCPRPAPGALGAASRRHVRPAATGDMRRTRADTTRFEQATGWRARTSLRDGLAAHWAWAAARVGAV